MKESETYRGIWVICSSFGWKVSLLPWLYFRLFSQRVGSVGGYEIRLKGGLTNNFTLQIKKSCFEGV